MTRSYSVPPEAAGKRIQDYLMKSQGYSLRLIRRMKQQPASVLQNGRPARMIDRLEAGDLLAVTLPPDGDAPSGDAPRVPIAYEDEDLLVYHKPPFLAVHPCRDYQTDTLAQVFLRDMAERGRKGARFRPIYRLDRDTDGLIAIAKDPLTAARLAGSLYKEYTAVVHGSTPPSGTVDAPIAQLEPHRMQRGVRADGQRAVTHYETLACNGRYSLIRLRLETGRTHQIRVHMAYIGHPVAGDPMYNPGDCSGLDRQALTCTCLRIPAGEGKDHCEICINMQAELLNLVKNE